MAVTCAAAASIPALAPAANLSLNEALAAAEKRSPLVREAEAAVEEAAGARDTASALAPANPELDVSFRTDRPFANQGEWGLDLGLTQELEIFGQRGLRLRVADAEVSVAKLELAATRLAVRARVALVYWQVVYQERRTAALAQVVDLATRLEAAARARLAAGDVPEAEHTLLRADLVAARAELRAAEADRDAARARLNVLVGRPATEATATTDELPALAPAAPLDALLARARERSPELAAARQELAARDADVALARRERLPNPTIGVGYAFERSAFDHHDVVPSGAFDTLSDSDHFLGLSLSIPLPIFRTGGGEVRRARGARGAAQARLDGVDARLVEEVTAARARYEQARASAADYAEVVAELATLLDRYEKAYVDGKVGLTELLAVRDRVLAATLAALEARHDAAVAAVELELAVGGDYTGAGR
jgi:cobalt-zinc-cadmium efflux system outer membrane protein